MNEPDFSTAYQNASSVAIAPEGPDRPVESASASTACQTNGSRFAYIVTLSALGVASLVLIAIALLFYTVFTTAYDQYGTSGAYVWDYDGDFGGDPFDEYYGFDGYLQGIEPEAHGTHA